MKIDFRTYYNDPSFPYNEALELYRQSFEEYNRKGIVFMISKFTREQLIAELMDTYILAAFGGLPVSVHFRVPWVMSSAI